MKNRFALIDTVAHTIVALLILIALAACGGGGGGGADPATTPTVARIDIDRPTVMLTAPGQERQLSARASTSDGTAVDAKVSWTSSAPGQVQVDANGKVRAVTALGSAQIVAEVNGVRSTPVLVSTVELHPGTLLVRDAEVARIGTPEAAAAPAETIVYDVWLAGVAPPAPGALVLASETSPVGGRVVASAVEDGLTRVRLQVLNLPDLLARYDFNWTLDLSAYDIVWREPAATGTSQRARAAREHTLDETEVRLADRTIPPGSARPICTLSASAKLQTSPVKAKVSGNPKVEILSSRLNASLPPGRLRAVLKGDIKLETEVGLMAEAGLNGEVKCELTGGSIPIPLFAFAGLEIPLGIGAKASGTLEVASLDIGLAGELGATFELGVDCAPPAPCAVVHSAEPVREFKPHVKASTTEGDGLKVELKASAYLMTGLNVVLIQKVLVFKALEATAGPEQSADFGTLKRQADDLPYASNYKLKIAAEIGPGTNLKKAIEKLTGTEGDNFSFKLPIEVPLSESPNGTWKPDKTSALPDRDTVRLTIDVKPESTRYFALGYNIQSIEIHRRSEGEREFALLHTLGAAEPQARFIWDWSPTAADAGKNEFAVFAVSKLPVVRLEIGTVQEVQVGCIGGTGSARPQAQQSSGGVCKEQWIGRAEGETNDLIRFSMEEEPMVWEQDLTLQIGPGVSALRPRGSVRVQLLAHTNLGCTVTPEVFDTFPASSLMTVHRNVDPPQYTFGLQVDATITISCPNSAPLTFPTRVLSINGTGTLTREGTLMEFNQSSPQGRYAYRFELKPPDASP
jgi:hypothetical protein